MTRTTSLYLALLSALMLAGCGSLVQEVDPGRLPTATAKLVIHSYLSPQDTVLAVLVQAPQAVIGQQQNNTSIRNVVANAVVDLSDGTQTVRLPFSVRDQLYRLPIARLPILPGRTYTLSVSAPGFAATTAQSTVPVTVLPTGIEVDSVRSPQGQGSSVRYFSRLLWRDPVSVANFYTVSGTMRFDVTVPIFSRTNPPVVLRDTTFAGTRPLRLESGVEILGDQSRDGQAFISGTFADNVNYYEGPGATGITRNKRITLTLMTLDGVYFRYQEALSRYQTANDNPFAEPVLIPSNIQNGLGCFAALNRASITVRLK